MELKANFQTKGLGGSRKRRENLESCGGGI